MEDSHEAQKQRRLKTPLHGRLLHSEESTRCRGSQSRRCSTTKDTGHGQQHSRRSLRRRSPSLQRSRSPRHSRSSRRSPSPRRSRSLRRSRSPQRNRASLRGSPSVRNRSSHRAEQLEREREAAQAHLRSLEEELRQERSRQRDTAAKRAETQVRDRSPTFSSRDILNILNSIRNQPLAGGAHGHSSSVVKNHKNILPDFDPSSKNQRIDVWLKKVNECATVYGWDDRTTIHFSMQKLQGLARTWYESLDTILFSWSEWQEKLSLAFPFEQNYGQSLEDMLKRKSKYHEPIEVYYYEKLSLLNQCGIIGKHAVDCIIHGLTDKTIKSSALALRCSEPNQLLQFLMSNKEISNSFDRFNNSVKFRLGSGSISSGLNDKANNKIGNVSNDKGAFCFNCREQGHIYRKCPKPLIRCNRCHRVGHKGDKCPTKPEDKDNTMINTQKTMCISLTSPNSKFYKEVLVNGAPIKAFIDFGSEVCLLAKSESLHLMLECDSVRTPIRGFGNNVVYSLGKVTVELVIDGVSATTNCQVVEDSLLDVPLLVGQTYTEQSHVLVLKTAETLKFIDTNQEIPFNKTDIDDDQVVKIISVASTTIFGPAVIKARTEPPVNGPILLNSKVIGKPAFQYVVCGGVYLSKAGIVNIYVTPVSKCCILHKDAIISRSLNIQMVNRVCDTNKLVTDHDCIDISKVHIGDNISEEHRLRLLKLLNKFKDCFASNLKELGNTNVTEMNIEINSKRPIVYRPYRLSHKERDQVREMVGEMLDAGIVRESTSEYASPVILVRKKDGRMRMCIDYRMLNSVTIKERYPMPVIEDEISRLSGQAYFVTLDLFSGYYQVPISEQSKPLTSFVTPDGQFEFNRMPFGLANAPAVFQRMMNKVLGSARYSQATAYIDDVLIYGTSVEQCLERLDHILSLLKQANLTLNLAKCEFLKDKIDYLGYEISALGVRPGDRKVQSVFDFPRPINIHNVRQFLGLVGYFRKFIMNFAQIAHPLNKLLKKDAAWCWSDEQENAFKTLKHKLIDRPVLAIYDPSNETELHTDASKYGIGGILLQRRSNSDNFRPVAFYSRQTSPEERNFHAYELETLAVVCSLRKFRVYLLGQNFKIVTDCSALRSTFAKRDIIPRIARWYLLIQEFECTIEYRPGNRMAHVDALSRNPIIEAENKVTIVDATDQYPQVMVITGDDWLHTLQIGDSELGRIRDILTSQLDVEGLKQIRDNYVIKDNKLYRCIDGDKTNIRWVVPKGARWQLCRMNHDDIGHFGVEKTLERIKSAYWFPKMSKFVKKYVEACIECAYSKKTTSKEGYLHPIPKVQVPFHTVHIDHLGPFVRSKRGNSYILLVVDAFTKFVFIRPVRNTKSQVAIRVLDEIFCTFRVPDRIISDRGSCFTSHAFRKFCLDKGTKHVLNAVASPRSNGQVERYNRTILASLTARNLNCNEKDWDDKVGQVQWGINNTVNKTTGRMATEIMFGSCMVSELDPKFNELRRETQDNSNLATIREEVKDKIDKEQEKQKEHYDKKRRPARVYSEGDLVKITNNNFNNDGKSKKLLPQYIGPYRVISVLGNDRYRIVAIPGLSSSRHKRKTTVAADRMQPWVHVAALSLNDNDSDYEDHDICTDTCTDAY